MEEPTPDSTQQNAPVEATPEVAAPATEVPATTTETAAVDSTPAPVEAPLDTIPPTEPVEASAVEETRDLSPSDPAAPAPPPVAPTAAPAADPQETMKPQIFNFLNNKEVYTKPQFLMPEEADVTFAKSYLKAQAGPVGNVYDHMTAIVMRLLETRPSNSLDVFEQISSDLKRSKFQVEQPETPAAFKRIQPTSEELKLAASQIKLIGDNDGEEADAEGSGELPDILELSKLWEWGGISFGKEETYLLFLSIKKLVEDKSLKSVRLWGKILGTERNYIVVEGELKEGATDEEEVPAEPAAEEEASEEKKEGSEEDATLPKPKVRPVPPVPKETRTGANKYVYYVCHYAGGEWTRLPDVIPDKIQTSQKIRKYFTGNLNKMINSYPIFNGTEAQYLSCQIARISAATVVSPAGYYQFDPEEEDADENERNAHVIVNNEFEGFTNDQLSNLANWVHHVPYILPQGRTIWENPYLAAKAAAGEPEEEEEDEEGSNAGDAEKNPGKDLEPEQGPPMLTPLSADEDNGDIPAWSARSCSQYAPNKFNPVVLKSSRWPGSTVVAYNDKFTNIYVGDGLKSLGNPSQAFAIPKLAEVQKEFAPAEGAPELVELLDPTLEEEKAFDDAQKAKEGGEKNEDGEEEEADAEGDDD